MRGNFIYRHCGCTSIYPPLCYPFRSLTKQMMRSQPTDSWTDRQTAGQTNRQTDRQLDVFTCKCIVIIGTTGYAPRGPPHFQLQFFKKSQFDIFLVGVLFSKDFFLLGRQIKPPPKIVKNLPILPITNEELPCKGEPYRLSGQRDPLLHSHRSC